MIVFPYTSNEQLEFGIKNIISPILAPKKMKHWVLNLTKYVQDLIEENHKTDERHQWS